MTIEEAIKMLKSKLDGNTDTSYEWAECVRLSVNALEKITEPPKSNADRIRQMTDEELAEFLTYGDFCAHETCGFYSCEQCALKWLRKEADEDAGTD